MRPRAARRLQRTRMQIDTLIDSLAAVIATMIPPARCSQPAMLFLSTGTAFQNEDRGQVSFSFETDRGAQRFTFASGTPQSEVIQALNSFSGALQLHAEQSTENP